MRTIVDNLFATQAKSHRRWLASWAMAGAMIQTCLPTLHGAVTPLGPVALWLWLLPAAAIGMDLLLERSDGSVSGAASRAARRRRLGAVRRRRDRLLAAPRPAARPVRRAG